jgi:hypothetical protein
VKYNDFSVTISVDIVLKDFFSRLAYRPFVPFGVMLICRYIKRSRIPTKAPKCQSKGQFQVKTKMLNNFRTERDRQIMSTDHLHKGGVTKSNGDVTFGVSRPLVTETTV